MTIQKVKNGEDFSPFTANRIKSPFAKKTQTRTGEFCDVMMVRTFGNTKINGVIVRMQVWRCPETGNVWQDDEQKECAFKAAELAKTSDKPVLFYHTKAWKCQT